MVLSPANPANPANSANPSNPTNPANPANPGNPAKRCSYFELENRKTICLWSFLLIFLFVCFGGDHLVEIASAHVGK